MTYSRLSPATTAIARRLSREAQGAEVLVGGRVFRVAKGDFTFEELTTIDVPADPDTQPDAKDDEPARARIYRLRGPKERAERLRERNRGQLRLLGRELELKTLRDIYRDVLMSRRKRQVLIAGGRSTSSTSSTLNTAELFDPAANGCIGAFIRTTGDMTRVRVFHTASLLPGTDGKVLIAGEFGLTNIARLLPQSPTPVTGDPEVWVTVKLHLGRSGSIAWHPSRPSAAPPIGDNSTNSPTTQSAITDPRISPPSPSGETSRWRGDFLPGLGS